MKEIKKEASNSEVNSMNSIKIKQDYIKIKTIQIKKEEKILKKDLNLQDINLLVHLFSQIRYYGDYLYMSVEIFYDQMAINYFSEFYTNKEMYKLPNAD